MPEPVRGDARPRLIRVVLVWRLVGLLLIGLTLPELGRIVRSFWSYWESERARAMVQGPAGFFGWFFDLIAQTLADWRFYSKGGVQAAGMMLGLYLVLTRARWVLAITRRYLPRCETTSGSS